MASRVELRELTRYGSQHVETTQAEVDSRDSDDCLDLLRRMAKRRGKKPADCELVVKTGRHTERYRI